MPRLLKQIPCHLAPLQATVRKIVNVILEQGHRLRWGFLLCLFCLGTPCSHAGIPEPGILVYGKVFDSQAQQVTDGELAWGVSGSGVDVSLSVPLASLDAAGGPFSYVVVLPLEMGVPGYPVGEDAIPVTDSVVSYARTAEVTGEDISYEDTVSISRDSIGLLARIDIDAPENYHSGDTNYDNLFSLRELMRMIELYTGSETHEYHCDDLGEDHYGLGFGAKDCDAHSGDFEGGGAWVISQEEVMRMIELFSSTMEHAYCLDASTEDGFRAGVCGGEKLAAVLLPDVEFTRTVEPALESEGPVWDVTITITAGAFANIRALGLRESLPPGWAFGGLVDGTVPSIGPCIGKPDRIRFVWFPVPESDCSFTYRLLPPEGSSLKPPAMRGVGLHRVLAIPGTHVSVIKSLRSGSLEGQPVEGIPDLAASLPAKPTQYRVGGPFLPSSRPGAIREAVASLIGTAQANHPQASADVGPGILMAASAPGTSAQSIPLPGADEAAATSPVASFPVPMTASGGESTLSPNESQPTATGPTLSETQLPLDEVPPAGQTVPVEADLGHPNGEDAPAQASREDNTEEGELAALNIPNPGDAPVPVAWWPALIAFALIPAARILRDRKRR